MRKLIVAMMIGLSSLMAGTVGANSDGKIMDKAFLDITIGDEVNYQYVKYNGNGFELESRKLNKVFNMYKQQGLKGGKFVINGKFELPKDVGNKAVIVIKGAKRTTSQWEYGNLHIHTYINNKKLKSDELRTITKVSKDTMGVPFVDLKIEAVYTRGTAINDFLPKLRKETSSMKFFVSYQGKQAKRGASVEVKEVPLRAYVLED